MRRFIENANEHIGSPPLPIPHAPHHITTLAPENAYDSDVPIQTVRIRYVETFYDGENIIVLEDKVVREIEMTSPLRAGRTLASYSLPAR